MNKNISIVTACKNRNDCLMAVLPSWLQYKQVKEIIIVDWSSQESLKHLLEVDSRIKIIRVNNEKYYIPSQANNLAVSFATGDYILRVDTDYFFNPYFNFFNTYEINGDCFVSGEPEIGKDRDNNPYYKYLFGLLYVSKENFLKVGGYDENIGRYYSHEDSNIFERLKLMGLKQIKLKNNFSVIHIPHSDKKRYENFEGGQNTVIDEYTTVETHIGTNLQLFKKPERFYISSAVKWNTEYQEKNYYEVIKEQNKLNDLPIVNCISLEESKNRRECLLKQFKKYNINYINFLISKRFTECNDIVTGKLSYTLSDGHKGCSVSHLKMIQTWYENTAEPYGFFCEDDLSLETVDHWNFSWKDFVKKLPNDWECVQLLYLKDKGNIESNILKEREWNDWSVTCYILTREYAKKIIDRYIKNNSFHLELANLNTQPLIENILFTDIGKVYSIALFVENNKYESTFVVDSNHNSKLHQLTHANSYNRVINMWKNKDKIVDYFTFYEPLGKEMLELRINMLKDYVDEFIVCESNKTQSGIPTPYKLKSLINELKFNNVNIKVIELDIPDDNELKILEEDRINCYENNFYNENSLKARARERLQKDAFLHVINDYTDRTVFLCSDIDEIIEPKNIKFISEIVKNNPEILIKIPLIHLEGRADLRVYNKDTNTPKEWTGMFMCTKGHFLKATPTQLRSNANNPYPVNFVTQNGEILKDLGWHFSWMGTPEIRKIKCKNFAHYDDTFEFLTTSKYKNEDTNIFQEQLLLQEGNIPPSGDKTLILKNFPKENLPQNIFSLPRVKNFLLPAEEYKWLIEFATNVDNPEYNFKAGIYYFERSHTAPALSFFLRCAERTNDYILAYEALIYGYLCYKEQKIRDETAKSLIMHALCLMPERPEARWLLSVFYEQKQNWMESYYHAERGLENCEKVFESLKTYKDYPGKIGLLFQKALAGYWWGKNEECKNILLDLYTNYPLNDIYKQSVKDNLKRIGVKTT
jgi:GR25 family glycosyltransferase involved in LPS biosynthesis